MKLIKSLMKCEAFVLHIGFLDFQGLRVSYNLTCIEQIGTRQIRKIRYQARKNNSSRHVEGTETSLRYK